MKTIPAWRPDTASRCEAPLRANSPRIGAVSPLRSPASHRRTEGVRAPGEPQAAHAFRRRGMQSGRLRRPAPEHLPLREVYPAAENRATASDGRTNSPRGACPQPGPHHVALARLRRERRIAAQHHPHVGLRATARRRRARP